MREREREREKKRRLATCGRVWSKLEERQEAGFADDSDSDDTYDSDTAALVPGGCE